MTPEQKRKFNTTFGSVFMGSGIVAWLLTVYFAVTPNPPKPVPVIGAPTVDLASCRSVLSSLGFESKIKDSDVIAFEALSANPKEQLQKATLAATVCKLPMKSFCMGEGCEQPGMTVIVTRQGSAKSTAATNAKPVPNDSAKASSPKADPSAASKAPPK